MADPYAAFSSADEAPVKDDPYAVFSSPTEMAPKRAPAATGWSAVGQTVGDLLHSGPVDHDPNALEQGIMNVAGHPLTRSVVANYKSAVMNGVAAEPVRAAMEGVGYGRQRGETDAQFHQRYNNAIIQSRQQAAQEMANSRIGDPSGHTDPITGRPMQPTIGDRAARLGQQVINTGAGIVANPQYFLLPGMGIGNTIATRIAAAGAGNAVVGGVSDAAAQLMDKAEGVQKDFDVQRNLESTITAGLFGAALHGAVEVTPFVKGLFATRGVDTKPSANPRASKISPQTTDHVAMNQADSMQYRQLLQHGSVDDIKGFFQGRNGPQPKWQEVNDWVEHRDGQHPVTMNGQPGGPNPAMRPDFDYEGEMNQHAEQQYASQNRQAIQDHIDNQMAGWKNAPQVEVVPHPEHITDPEIRAQALKDDPKGDALGFLGPDGKIRIFSGRITDPDTASAVLFHEGLGHYGLDQKFGTKLDSTIASLLDRNVSKFAQDVAKWQKKNPKAYGGDRIRAAEEVLAEMSQNGRIKPTLQNAVTSAVKQFGRKMGLKIAYSDAEVNHVLAMSHDAVINGKPSASANGFRGAKQNPNKNMFIGQKAKGFSPHDPTAYRADDGQLRNEISDKGAYLKHQGDTLGDILHHPELFDRYPELRDLPVKHTDDANDPYAGYYQAGDAFNDKHMSLNSATFNDPVKTVLHETQHAIQDIEGYPDFVRAMKKGGTNHDDLYNYSEHPSELEAEEVEKRHTWSDQKRIENMPKFVRKNAMGEEQTEDRHLSDVERLKADPRFWSDPEFRANVIEMARSQQPIDRTPRQSDLPQSSGFKSEAEARAAQNKFMRREAESDNDNKKPIMQTIADVIAGKKDLAPDLRSALAKSIPALTDNQLWKAVKDLDMQVWEKFRVVDPVFMWETTNPEAKLWLKDPVNRAILDEYKNRSSALRDMLYAPLQSNDNVGNKFINRQQLDASSPDYVADDLERVYHALDEGYTPTVRTWEEDRQAALKAGFSPSQIKALKETNPGELSTRLYRIQSAANLAHMKLADLHEKLDTPEWSEKDQADYIKAIADFNYLAVRVKGERAEIARAQNVAKAAASYSKGTMEQMAELLEQEGSGLGGLAFDPTSFFKFARQMKQVMGPKGPNGGPPMANPAGTNALMQGVNKPYWEQYLTSFHYNAMLSGLSTHVKAPLDMMTGIVHSIIDHTLSMPIGKVANVIEGLTGQTVKPGIKPAEVAARLYGITRAVFDHEVHMKTLEALKTGEGSAVLPNKGNIPTNPAHTYLGTANPRLGLLSKPTDLIVAQDTFFRSVSVSESLYGLGVREAEAQLKASGQPYNQSDVLTLGGTIAHNPTPSMIKEARAVAEKALLLNPNRLTSWIDKVKNLRPGATAAERLGSFLANNLAPFIRVAANSLMTRVIERSPLQLLSKGTRETIMKGGPESHLAIARIVYGTVKLGLLWGAAALATDKLTGEGPDNPNKRKELQAAGWRPNAVHENGGYNTGGTLAMSLNPFDLHNSTAQMVASMRQAYDKGANEGQVGAGLMLALGSFLHTFESETWVDSMAPAVAAANADGSTAYKINQFAAEEAKSWVPNVLGQISRMTNPNRVDARAETDELNPTNIIGSSLNAMQSAIPGLNTQLPTQYSVYGDPIPTGQNIAGVHTVIPGLEGNNVKSTTDPTEIELNRLARLTKAAVITPVQRSFHVSEDNMDAYTQSGRRDLKIDENGNVKLNSRQFQEYQRMAGRYIVEDVKQEMNSPEWQTLSDKEKIERVRSIQTDQKANAREALFQ